MTSKTAPPVDFAKIQQHAVILLAAWMIPGGGHFWLRKWGRGALLCGSLSVLFLSGVVMHGRFFSFLTAGMIETVGFLGNLCAGFLFLAARLLGYNPLAAASPVADFGTKFLLIAGLLNILCILDAFDIAVGEKD
ncbi:MAG: hypothetical protein A3F68_07205 [Acidobacteria bacterium RIFCSPLOWO2_12_FULL_54_10]|nr:MAG: hypothetical protein A3F68_07205 [Acidobacteria bacterium RIFCSPLOWO2_12_FULL_54_10]